MLFSLGRRKQAIVISKMLLLKIDCKERSALSVCLFLSVVFVLRYFCVCCMKHSYRLAQQHTSLVEGKSLKISPIIGLRWRMQ